MKTRKVRVLVKWGQLFRLLALHRSYFPPETTLIAIYSFPPSQRVDMPIFWWDELDKALRWIASHGGKEIDLKGI